MARTIVYLLRGAIIAFATLMAARAFLPCSFISIAFLSGLLFSIPHPGPGYTLKTVLLIVALTLFHYMHLHAGFYSPVFEALVVAVLWPIVFWEAIKARGPKWSG